MKHIQIRNVSNHTHRVLMRRAREAGLSLQEYLLTALNELAARPTVEEVLARAERHSGGRFGLEAAAADLRADRAQR